MAPFLFGIARAWSDPPPLQKGRSPLGPDHGLGKLRSAELLRGGQTEQELSRTRLLHGGRTKQELTRMRCMQGGQSMQELSRTRFSQGGQTTQVLSRTIYSTSPMLAARRQDTALSMSADKLPSLRPCSAEEQHGVTGEPARRPRRVSLNSPYHSSTGLKHTHLELCHIRIQKHDCDP